ncbi:hypothetical protein [Escherichia coli]|uniref:hypothetical protein n=1 Tax=Escherichia coli TaxID=562 RepID=UPI001FCE7AFC|nr:hypothetical protein [Escherichia coli]
MLFTSFSGSLVSRIPGAVQAAKQGKSYKILGAFFKNRVYMIAKLIPVSKNDAS